ncbi:hypothetical protein CP8484711_2183B, partial [Chlamydia psittaci 84-8471/1]
ADSYQ